EGRVDHMRAQAICEKLAALGEEDDQGEEEKNETATPAGAEDPEITAILDGPSPAVPPTAPPPPPTDFALQDFDKAISTLKRVRTKPLTQFTRTIHSADDLEGVKSFIDDVMKAKVLVSPASPTP